MTAENFFHSLFVESALLCASCMALHAPAPDSWQSLSCEDGVLGSLTMAAVAWSWRVSSGPSWLLSPHVPSSTSWFALEGWHLIGAFSN